VAGDRWITYPFAAIVGQQDLKTALVLNAIDPLVGGVLIRGQKGTAKSTAVRGLKDILPEISVVDGCRYACDPMDKATWCHGCRDSAQEDRLPSIRRRPTIVDLPVSATEDRLIGTIDIEHALKNGERKFEPGLLADANRGILYVDEVNLLDDHLVDTLLDVAAMGINTVEREGIAFSHPARFILVGTMNPEEGDVRPQLLDRFGLCVDIKGLADPDSRMEVIRRRQEYDRDPAAFVEAWIAEQATLESAIEAAQERLSDVVLGDKTLRMVATLCAELSVDGHRADLTMCRAGASLAALEGVEEVLVDHIRRVAPMVLAHRFRRRPFEEGASEEARLSQALESLGDEDGKEESRSDPQDPDPGSEDASALRLITASGEVDLSVPTENTTSSLVSDFDRERRQNNGRRHLTESKDQRGRYIRAKPIAPGDPVDLALDATLREAAVHQAGRKKGETAIKVERSDLRNKVRERRVGASIVFCVDASGSMGASTRMEAAKAAILELLVDAYKRRDRVGMVAFHGDDADLLLSPTASVELAQLRLRSLPTGGATPIAHGIRASLEVLDDEVRMNAETIPWLVLVTDGRANVGIKGGHGSEDARSWAGRIRHAGINAIVLDTDTESSRPGAAKHLARLADARYIRLAQMDGPAVAGAVKTALVGG